MILLEGTLGIKLYLNDFLTCYVNGVIGRSIVAELANNRIIDVAVTIAGYRILCIIINRNYNRGVVVIGLVSILCAQYTVNLDFLIGVFIFAEEVTLGKCRHHVKLTVVLYYNIFELGKIP